MDFTLYCVSNIKKTLSKLESQMSLGTIWLPWQKFVPASLLSTVFLPTIFSMHFTFNLIEKC